MLDPNLPEAWDDRKRGQCIFCDRKATTKEDYWPSWFQKTVPYRSDEYYIPYDSHAYVVDGRSTEKISNKKRSGLQIRQTVKVLCGDCNNVWGSAIQESVKDLILSMEADKDACFSDDELRKLAVWAVMFTMTSEFHYPQNVSTDQRTRVDFRLTGKLPSTFTVCIGRYIGDGFHHGRQQLVRRAGCGVGERQNIIYLQQVTAFGFKNFFFQVFSLIENVSQDRISGGYMMPVIVKLPTRYCYIVTRDNIDPPSMLRRRASDIVVQSHNLQIIDPERQASIRRMHDKVSVIWEADRRMSIVLERGPLAAETY